MTTTPIKIVRKRIILDEADPDTAYVDIPVIDRVTTVIAADQYQEVTKYLRNNISSGRRVRVQKVFPATIALEEGFDPATAEPFIECERILDMPTTVAQEQYQDRRWILLNNDPAPKTPSGLDDPAHEKVHYVRFYKDNDTTSDFWVDCEYIDILKVVVAAEQYQEYRVYMRHPLPGEPADDPDDPYNPTIGFCDPTLDLAPKDDELDPPYRLDPYQNIVNWSGLPGDYVLVCFSWRDYITSNLGERCTLTDNDPDAPIPSTFTPGVQSTVTSAEDISIEYVDENSATSGALLNGTTATGQPDVVVTEQFVQGYPTFPECFDCPSSNDGIVYPSGDPHFLGTQLCPPGSNPPPTFAEPVPYNKYEQSFLLDLQPSDPVEEETATGAEITKILFDIFGIKDPEPASNFERTLPTYPGGPDLPSDSTISFDEYINNNMSAFRWDVYVFKKSEVDIYLEDTVFPLRKKGIIPTAPTAVAQTQAIFRTKTIDFSFQWIDPDNNLHEPLSDADPITEGTGGSTAGSTGGGTIRLTYNFENFTLPPGGVAVPGTQIEVDREVVWPFEPATTFPDQVIAGNIDAGTEVIGQVSTRQYSYRWKVNGVTQAPDRPIETGGDIEFDYGIDPLNNTA